jgi:hypothetical protein
LDALKEGQMAFFLAIGDIAETVDQRVSQFLYDREEFISAINEVEANLEKELPPNARQRVLGA